MVRFGFPTVHFDQAVEAAHLHALSDCKEVDFSHLLAEMKAGKYGKIPLFVFGLRFRGLKHYIEQERKVYIQKNHRTSKPFIAFSHAFNSLTRFVVCSILLAKNSKEQRNLIGAYFQVAKQLAETGALNFSRSVLLAFSNFEIMECTGWKSVKVDQTLQVELKTLETSLHPKEILIFERELLSRRDATIIFPPMGEYLRKIELVSNTSSGKIVRAFFDCQNAAVEWVRYTKRKGIGFHNQRVLHPPSPLVMFKLGIIDQALTQGLADSLHFLVVEHYLTVKVGKEVSPKKLKVSFQDFKTYLSGITSFFSEQVVNTQTSKERGYLVGELLSVVKGLVRRGEINLAGLLYDALLQSLGNDEKARAHLEDYKGAKALIKWLSDSLGTESYRWKLMDDCKDFEASTYYVDRILIESLQSQKCIEQFIENQQKVKEWYKAKQKSEFPVNLFQELQHLSGKETKKNRRRRSSKRSDGKKNTRRISKSPGGRRRDLS